MWVGPPGGPGPLDAELSSQQRNGVDGTDHLSTDDIKEVSKPAERGQEGAPPALLQPLRGSESPQAPTQMHSQAPS